jgi:hypothetical protein
VRAADKPQLELSDPKLPLYELRPLDRRVYGLTLEGTWNKPAKSGVHHYVNVIFPSGRTYSARVDENPKAVRRLTGESNKGLVSYREVEDSPFRRGEVRCLIPNNQLIRHGVARGGRLTIVVSAGKPVESASATEVISNALEVNWPLAREIVRRPPRSRFADPGPVDAMPLPGDEPKPETSPAARPGAPPNRAG